MELLPISALQHLLYCERQCALIHIEQLWAENRFTAEGNVMHEKAHEGPDSTMKSEISDGRIRVVRGLAVKSEALGLSGECDVVEFHADGTVLPIEYKRGKPKTHRADEVQLCAQALCLEETPDCSSRGNEAQTAPGKSERNGCAIPNQQQRIQIPEGRLFYGQTRRRVNVVFDAELRELTINSARRLHELIASRVTPPAEYEERKCEACSLKELCLPQAMRFQKGARAWFQRQMAEMRSEI